MCVERGKNGIFTFIAAREAPKNEVNSYVVHAVL